MGRRCQLHTSTTNCKCRPGRCVVTIAVVRGVSRGIERQVGASNQSINYSSHCLQTGIVSSGEDNSAPTLTTPPSLNFTFTTYNTTFCEDPLNVYFLLVLVHSAPVHFHNREVIRQTWASKAWRERQQFAVLFLLGASVSDAVQAKARHILIQFVVNLWSHYLVNDIT